MSDQHSGNDSPGDDASAAIGELCVRCADELRAYLTGLLKNPELAAEVMQATVVKAIEHGAAARTGSEKAWLFRIAHNEAMDRRRRAATEVRVGKRWAWWNRPPTGTELSPAGPVLRDETARRVRAAIAALPPEQQEVVRLRIDEELTFAEIAALTGSPLGTVLTRMRLATKKLAETLRGEWDV